MYGATEQFLVLGEINALAGCDLLTISPKLLEELDSSSDEVYESLTEKSGKYSAITQLNKHFHRIFIFKSSK